MRKTPLFITLCIAQMFARMASADSLGAPPPDAKANVGHVGAAKDAPKLEQKEVTTANLGAGLQLTTGNSRLFAATASGGFEVRRGRNGFLGGILANYGEGSASATAPRTTTAENAQAKLRYERYFLDPLAGFLQLTGRYDRFQGLEFRLNVDPGVKVMLLQNDHHALWLEAGYDLQHDIRLQSARGLVDADGNPLPNQPNFLDKTYTDHSARGYLGYRLNFNKLVSLSAGLEYIQSFRDIERARLNFDTILTATLFDGFALGLSFNARFDNQPLPSKERLDTVTTVTLIYTWEKKEPPPPPPPPCAAVPCAPVPCTAPPPAK